MKPTDILAFAFNDSAWDMVPIGLFKAVAAKCHDLHQVELLRLGESQGPADVLLMWSWLTQDAEKRYAAMGISGLRPSDIGTEGNLWLIALSAPGGAEHLVAALGWAAKNLPVEEGKERFRCLAPIEPNGRPQPVVFAHDGKGGGSIKPIHV
ncbi:hypothetical protein [Paracoccus sp. J56]|uniref:hypothetical protein n=2 Tax=Paracoccaceae TaxID=31989 RepID=UPI000225FC16|nr:hypothetical protein [Paracoccus sp. J56]SMG06690.1 hypothetical protein SAMN02746000_00211 [Paracoccus sp. J56]